MAKRSAKGKTRAQSVQTKRAQSKTTQVQHIRRDKPTLVVFELEGDGEFEIFSGSGSFSGWIRVDMVNLPDGPGDFPVIMRTIMTAALAKRFGEGLVEVSNKMTKEVN